MRFMMLMIPKGYESAAPGTMPDAKAIAAMMKYIRQVQEMDEFPAETKPSLEKFEAAQRGAKPGG